jgi:hypothetical protein
MIYLSSWESLFIVTYNLIFSSEYVAAWMALKVTSSFQWQLLKDDMWLTPNYKVV